MSACTYSQLRTGVPEVVGEQLLLQVYACLKIKYHVLSVCFFKTHLLILLPGQKKQPGIFSQGNGILWGPCLTLSVSTYQGCLSDALLSSRFSFWVALNSPLRVCGF